MKKVQEQKSKLSIKKFQISKIKNPQVIFGGADDPITIGPKDRPKK